jgi:acyl-CoA synthetase (AMP-forming)/AMP-acid ligase II
VAFNGAEPVRRETLELFCAKFGPLGFRREAFYPCYGLAEATLMVTGGSKSAPPAIDGTAVGCGTSIDDQEVRIVDPVSQRQSEQGEIWVAGPSVAAGYWQQPALTDETFHAVLDGKHFLRTGDLGYCKNGELYVTGRLKALIVVGGRKIHAEDVERSVASSHPAGRAGCVAAIEVGRGLVVVQEIDRRRAPADLGAVVRAIRLQVAEDHQVPVDAVVLTGPRGVPRTSSGKVQRAACRDAFVAGSLNALFEWRRPISAFEGEPRA